MILPIGGSSIVVLKFCRMVSIWVICVCADIQIRNAVRSLVCFQDGISFAKNGANSLLFRSALPIHCMVFNIPSTKQLCKRNTFRITVFFYYIGEWIYSQRYHENVAFAWNCSSRNYFTLPYTKRQKYYLLFHSLSFYFLLCAGGSKSACVSWRKKGLSSFLQNFHRLLIFRSAFCYHMHFSYCLSALFKGTVAWDGFLA